MSEPPIEDHTELSALSAVSCWIDEGMAAPPELVFKPSLALVVAQLCERAVVANNRTMRDQVVHLLKELQVKTDTTELAQILSNVNAMRRMGGPAAHVDPHTLGLQPGYDPLALGA